MQNDNVRSGKLSQMCAHLSFFTVILEGTSLTTSTLPSARQGSYQNDNVRGGKLYQMCATPSLLTVMLEGPSLVTSTLSSAREGSYKMTNERKSSVSKIFLATKGGAPPLESPRVQNFRFSEFRDNRVQSNGSSATRKPALEYQ